MLLEDKEIEKNVVSALLDANGLPGSNLWTLVGEGSPDPEDFTTAHYGRLMGCLVALANRETQGDPVQLSWNMLKRMPNTHKDGLQHLTQLQVSNTCDRATYLAHCAELKELRAKREVLKFADDLRTFASHGSATQAEIAAKLDSFSQAFTSTSREFHSLTRYHMEVVEAYEAALSGTRETVLPTGVVALDKEIGGFVENLNIVGGASSVGKSAFLATAIREALIEHKPIAYFGLEDGIPGLIWRFLALHTGLPLRSIVRPRPNAEGEAAKFAAAIDYAENIYKPFLHVWAPEAGERVTSADLLQRCKRAIYTHKVRGIFIDHALEIEYQGAKGEDLRLRIDRTFSQLRSLAVRTHTPIIVVVHFNRAGATREGPPRQEDFAECAGIERLSRLSLGLWTNPETDTDEDLRLTIMKQTQGKSRIHFRLKRHVEAAMVRTDGAERVEWSDRKANGTHRTKAERWMNRREDD